MKICTMSCCVARLGTSTSVALCQVSPDASLFETQGPRKLGSERTHLMTPEVLGWRSGTECICPVRGGLSRFAAILSLQGHLVWDEVGQQHWTENNYLQVVFQVSSCRYLVPARSHRVGRRWPAALDKKL